MKIFKSIQIFFGQKIFGEMINYRRLRFVMSLIAITLPVTVTVFSKTQLTSISASYYSETRYWFVGLLFFISALLLVYNGHNLGQNLWSKVAAVAAILVALNPTNCDGCAVDSTTWIHYGAALLLFVILAFFCFLPFSANAKEKGGRGELRQKIYKTCGGFIFIFIGLMALAWIFLPEDIIKARRIIYWGEFLSLLAFSVSWGTASQVSPINLLHRLRPGQDFLKGSLAMRADFLTSIGFKGQYQQEEFWYKLQRLNDLDRDRLSKLLIGETELQNWTNGDT